MDLIPRDRHHGHHSEPYSSHFEVQRATKTVWYSCILDKYESFEITPVLGNEYLKVKLVDWIRHLDFDEVSKNLAITGEFIIISDRGSSSNEHYPKTIPAWYLPYHWVSLQEGQVLLDFTSHPIFNSERDHADYDNEINTISPKDRKVMYASEVQRKKKQSHNNWHTDLGFEPVPGYCSVFMPTEVPETEVV
ncbi:hypothetical protein SBOR_2854 [Sclerotinia borealis F-4128]|uniref:TauD/TfdA-like domain-containing protein n=1 Tax=Sclerotinia borealis (strain F-4128) TaxID=1432307 RepID=W9CQ95_SCLBF|nr:hypothetical protein SBOR_2854 [Sclerotinia borealis F-4128]